MAGLRAVKVGAGVVLPLRIPFFGTLVGSAGMDRRALARWAAAAALLALAVHAASLGNGLVLDDAEVILDHVEATLGSLRTLNVF